MRVILSVVPLLVVLASGLACRELASPVAELGERYAVSGSVHRADGMIAWGARLEFLPQSSVFEGQFREVVIVDEDGHFELEVPGIALRVEILPPRGTGAAPQILEGVQLHEGEALEIVLPGFLVRGRIADPSEPSNQGTRLAYLRTAVVPPVLAIDEVFDGVVLDEKGSFELFAHREGEYRVDFQQLLSSGDTWLRVAEDLPISEGDSLELELPLVPIELEPTWRGESFVEEFSARTWSEVQSEDGTRNAHTLRWSEVLDPGRHRVYVAEGATEIFWAPTSRGFLNWVPNYQVVPPIQGGEQIQFELARYTLALSAEDAAGGPIQEEVRFTMAPVERLGFSRSFWLDPGSPTGLGLNAGTYRFRVSEGLYAGHEEILTVTGDAEMTLRLTRSP